MGKRIARCALILGAIVALSGCASVHTADGTRMHTLGIAEAEVCKHYEGREDKVIKECTVLATDAFSGWEAVMNGIANILVRVMTFGFKGV